MRAQRGRRPKRRTVEMVIELDKGLQLFTAEEMLEIRRRWRAEDTAREIRQRLQQWIASKHHVVIDGQRRIASLFDYGLIQGSYISTIKTMKLFKLHGDLRQTVCGFQP